MAAIAGVPLTCRPSGLAHRRALSLTVRVGIRTDARRHIVPKAGAVQELESVEDFEQFIAQDGLTLVDFYTTWCGPCKLIAPKVADMAEEITQVKFAKLNLTDLVGAGELTTQREVKSLPTFHMYQKVVRWLALFGRTCRRVDVQVQ